MSEEGINAAVVWLLVGDVDVVVARFVMGGNNEAFGVLEVSTKLVRNELDELVVVGPSEMDGFSYKLTKGGFSINAAKFEDLEIPAASNSGCATMRLLCSFSRKPMLAFEKLSCGELLSEAIRVDTDRGVAWSLGAELLVVPDC